MKTRNLVASAVALAAASAVMPAQVVKTERADVRLDGNPVAIYTGRDKDGKVAGYALSGRDGKGYGADIELMVGFEKDAKTVVCYRKLVASETPGLGSKLATPEFSAQFAGKDAETLKVKKDGGEIEAIAAATITSRAVCRAVGDARKTLAAALAAGK